VSSLSVLALMLALGAIVLATIANRRWARRPRGDEQDDRGDEQDELRDVRDSSAPVDRRTTVDLPSELEELRSRFEELRAWHEDLRSGLDDLRSQVAAQARHLDAMAAQAQSAGADPTALRHVALVRYDAFADVGGRLSYSVAVLDDTRSGLVLTTLAGKADVRTYVRAISGGATDGTLTAEEQQAIEAAGRQA
jgi:hypothetical protein